MERLSDDIRYRQEDPANVAGGRCYETHGCQGKEVTWPIPHRQVGSRISSLTANRRDPGFGRGSTLGEWALPDRSSGTDVSVILGRLGFVPRSTWEAARWCSP